MVLTTQLLHSSSTTSTTSSTISTRDDESEDYLSSPPSSPPRFKFETQPLKHHSIPCGQSRNPNSSKLVEVISGHTGSVSCLALCGEFVLSASHGNDIIAWQQPDLRLFARFGRGEVAAKALVVMGSKIFTAHQDRRIRVWKVSRSSENVFKLLDTLPTMKDYLVRFIDKKNHVQTRRHHKKLWIEHTDSISCLAVANGLIYSGSWDKTIKVWSMSSLKCLESITAHDDAINGLIAKNNLVYSASSDGTVKVWKMIKTTPSHQHMLVGILKFHKDVSINAIVVLDDHNRGLVYTGGSDGYMMGWIAKEESDELKWKLVCEIKAHETAVLCLCNAMGDEIVCSGSADKSICIWRRREENGGGGFCRIGVLRGHQGPVKCLQASLLRCVGDGFLLYSGGLDRSLRVWWVSMDDDETWDDDRYLIVYKKICIWCLILTGLRVLSSVHQDWMIMRIILVLMVYCCCCNFSQQF